MAPPNMQSSETGARLKLKDTIFHHGERLVERPDIKEHPRAGDTLVHLSKIDFQTGLDKMSQKKESEFDEDGSHNSGFQTLSWPLGLGTRPFLPTKHLAALSCSESSARQPKRTPGRS